jgi:hypothetical protein
VHKEQFDLGKYIEHDFFPINILNVKMEIMNVDVLVWRIGEEMFI